MKEDSIKLIKELSEMPIVQFVCRKVGISRATYYRWRKEDRRFTITTNKALLEGSFHINDLAESQLICLIKEKNMPAINFWLRHHHKAYSNKIQLILSEEDEILDEEQKELLEEALLLSSVDLIDSQNGKERKNPENNLEN